MLKQSLQQKLQQKLSPQQIQIVKLLELPTLQFEQRIKKELEENPVLEEGEEAPSLENTEENTEEKEEFTLEDYINEEDEPYYKSQTSNYSKDDKREEIPFSTGKSFQEHLLTQLGLRNLSEEDKKLAYFIIGNLDEDGYLRREIEAIVDDLAFTEGIETTKEKLEELLEVVQDFDPIGVGARDLRECLLLQIKRKKESPASILAYKILDLHFESFTKKHYERIIKKLNISRDDLREAMDEITKLNPRPGGSLGNSAAQTIPHITPDFILEYIDGTFGLSLNSKNIPDLKISNSYNEMLNNKDDFQKKDQKNAVAFVKQKISSAKWFIDAIKQRQQTLMSVMNAIIEKQYDFFIDGDERLLKPMILKDIAEETNLDISTISRVSNSKYVQTHFGILPLKYFFSESMQTESGEEVSTREIKKILQECVDNENKQKPLTDEKLADILKEKSYLIARRTVAKYREKLGIPIARLRKEL